MAVETAPCRGCGSPIARTVRVAPIRHYCSADCRPRCSVEGCGKAVHAHGMCGAHMQRVRATGDALTPRQRQPQRGECEVEGCDQPKRKTGWCAAHYAQTRRTGRPPTPFRNKWAVELRCVMCGVTTGIERGFRKYCSSACQQLGQRHTEGRALSVPCVACGDAIDLQERPHGKHRRHWVVKLCGRCRQDKRKHGWSVKQLAERDGTACGICGEVVDMTLRHPAPMRPSVDHILPRARGGTNAAENLQLAHLRCNQVKSDRVVC